MKKIIEFEFQRIKNRKTLYLLPVLLIVIGIAGVVLGNIYYDNLDSTVQVFNVYNSYSQFTFIFLSFIYIATFADDFNKGNYAFMRQVGYPLGKCLFVKALLLFLISAIVVSLFIITYSLLIINLKDLTYLAMILTAVNLGLLFTIIFSMLMAVLFKKTMIATVITFASYIVLDIVNLVGFGLTNPCDANSITCVTLSYFAGLPITHKSLVNVNLDFEKFKWFLTMLPSLGYILILLFIIMLFVRREKQYEN